MKTVFSPSEYYKKNNLNEPYRECIFTPNLFFFFLLGFTHEKTKIHSVSHEEKKISPEIFMHMNFFPPQKIFPPPLQNNLLCFHRWKKN